MRIKGYYLLFCFIMICFSCTKQEKRYRIGVSQCSKDDWRSQLNIELKRETFLFDNLQLDIRSAQDNIEIQNADIQYFIDHHYDLILASPIDSKKNTPILSKAFKKNIPIILFDRRMNNEDYTSYVGANNFGIGYALGSYLVQSLKDGGTYIEIKGKKDSSPVVERHAGMMKALQGHSSIKQLASFNADWKTSVAQEKIRPFLEKYKNVNYIVAQNDRMAKGAYLCTQEMGLDKKIHIIGIDGLPGKGKGLDLVDKGLLEATFIYPIGGEEMLHTALNILEKKEVPRTIYLKTAIVNSKNAKLALTEQEHILTLSKKIQRLNTRLFQSWKAYESQRFLIYACIVIVILAIIIMTLALKAYWSNKKLTNELRKQRDESYKLSNKLKKATKDKLIFFTNISHDFRTPLTLIAGPIKTLLENIDLTTKEKELLLITQRNVYHLLQLVNRILDFRKLENGKMKLKLNQANLSKQLKAWHQSFLPEAEKRDLSFLLDIQGKEEDFEMDYDIEKMDSIFINLLSNAFKFTPEKGTITLRLKRILSHEKPIAHFQIEDSGIGMEELPSKNIFERFYQIDNLHAGSGIGLALCKSLIELHNGSIKAISIPNKGTTFTVDLPITNTNIAYKDTSSITSRKALALKEMGVTEQSMGIKLQKETKDKEKPTLLLIEDNKDMRLYLNLLLTNRYQILEAKNGKEGLAIAIKQIPDVIISDVMMPIMDGEECCKRLKEEERTSHIPVILLTARLMEENLISGYKSGADAYIAKPFSTKLLITRIQNLVENRKRLKNIFADQKTLHITKEIEHLDKNFLERLIELIEQQYQNANLNVEDLAKGMGFSRIQLYRKLKALTDASPNELLKQVRLRKASLLLEANEKTISEITFEVGFTSPSYFSKCYKEMYGETPSEFLKKNRTLTK
ncbi:MAG: substrate-binding domain-containing protein [Massilibacteroides sp.]|nr:substrate-binding domain-containing protein [Massilibacteroides sp.]